MPVGKSKHVLQYGPWSIMNHGLRGNDKGIEAAMHNAITGLIENRIEAV